MDGHGPIFRYLMQYETRNPHHRPRFIYQAEESMLLWLADHSLSIWRLNRVRRVDYRSNLRGVVENQRRCSQLLRMIDY